MTSWIVLAVYVIGFSVCAYRIYPALLADLSYDEGPIDKAVSALLALLISLFWPLALPVTLLILTAKPTDAERTRALDDREANIRRMERELGIGKDD